MDNQPQPNSDESPESRKVFSDPGEPVVLGPKTSPDEKVHETVAGMTCLVIGGFEVAISLIAWWALRKAAPLGSLPLWAFCFSGFLLCLVGWGLQYRLLLAVGVGLLVSLLQFVVFGFQLASSQTWEMVIPVVLGAIPFLAILWEATDLLEQEEAQASQAKENKPRQNPQEKTPQKPRQTIQTKGDATKPAVNDSGPNPEAQNRSQQPPKARFLLGGFICLLVGAVQVLGSLDVLLEFEAPFHLSSDLNPDAVFYVAACLGCFGLVLIVCGNSLRSGAFKSLLIILSIGVIQFIFAFVLWRTSGVMILFLPMLLAVIAFAAVMFEASHWKLAEEEPTEKKASRKKPRKLDFSSERWIVESRSHHGAKKSNEEPASDEEVIDADLVEAELVLSTHIRTGRRHKKPTQDIYPEPIALHFSVASLLCYGMGGLEVAFSLVVQWGIKYAIENKLSEFKQADLEGARTFYWVVFAIGALFCIFGGLMQLRVAMASRLAMILAGLQSALAFMIYLGSGFGAFLGVTVASVVVVAAAYFELDERVDDVEQSEPKKVPRKTIDYQPREAREKPRPKDIRPQEDRGVSAAPVEKRPTGENPVSEKPTEEKPTEEKPVVKSLFSPMPPKPKPRPKRPLNKGWLRFASAVCIGIGGFEALAGLIVSYYVNQMHLPGLLDGGAAWKDTYAFEFCLGYLISGCLIFVAGQGVRSQDVEMALLGAFVSLAQCIVFGMLLESTGLALFVFPMSLAMITLVFMIPVILHPPAEEPSTE
ncbi:hypothetical protein GC197_05290 [bacterium]|nr:hypothetical protein [bacterium]